ncbi:MAG TPA: HD domain-containing phosphohydrolase [Thermoleophilaceae bacterium]
MLLAALSAGAALTLTAEGVPLPVRLAIVCLAALVIGLSVASLAKAPAGARYADVPAGTDSLTGLLDDQGFDAVLATELQRARAADRSFAVAIADVDALRAHAEWFGHDARDRVLRLVAHDLEKWKRRIDLAAHLGDGEFALLLPGTDAGGSLLVAERMRRAAHRSFAGERSRPTLSIGVALYPDHAGDAAGLIEAARQALAAAKELGRDRTALFSSEVESVLHSAAGEPAMRQLQLASLLALAEALDLRDHGDATHSHSVARHAEATALELGFGRAHAERVHLAGLLHDVGMIGVSPEAIRRQGPLDDGALAAIGTHPEVAARLLAGNELADVRGWIEAHHERPDGDGYPRGAASGQIPLEASILAVADAWEALTHARPYRAALDERAARAELQAHAGTQFDAVVVNAFLHTLERDSAPR